MADGATHSHSEGAYELGVAPVIAIRVKRFGIPLRLGFLVKIRIWEKPDTNYTARVAVNGGVDAVAVDRSFSVPQGRIIVIQRLSVSVRERFLQLIEVEAPRTWLGIF